MPLFLPHLDQLNDSLEGIRRELRGLELGTLDLDNFIAGKTTRTHEDENKICLSVLN